MSNSTRHQAHKRHTRHGLERPKPAATPMSDRAVYLGAIIIGLFVVILGGLLSEAAYWPHIGVAYVAFLLYQVSAAGWSAYLGKPLSDWRHSLAKIPLRAAGYGTTDGRPIEAAHGQRAVRTSLLVFGAASGLLVAGLVVFVLLWLTPAE